MKPTFKEVPSETATGQVVCEGFGLDVCRCLRVGASLRRTWCASWEVVWVMKPTFKEVPSETATGQVVCDV